MALLHSCLWLTSIPPAHTISSYPLLSRWTFRLLSCLGYCKQCHNEYWGAHILSNYAFRGRSQDGGGIGWGDHFLSYKFIERTIEHWANFTKQLLIAHRGHQVPRKAAHCLRREVGQNVKDKKRDKRARDGDQSREGSLNRGSSQSPGNPHTSGSGGSFRISEGNLTGRKN